MKSNVIIYCDGKEVQVITDKCYEIYTNNGCETCVLHDAVCKKDGGITFRIRRKANDGGRSNQTD